MAVAAIAAFAVVFAVTRLGGTGQGPLVPLISGKVGMGWILHVGQSGSISGPLIIRNASDRQLVLDRVEGVGLQNGGPDILGAYVLSRPNSIGRVFGYRVPANGRALPGAVIAPHAQVELVFGVKATKPGRHSFTALDIVYHDSAGSYTSQAALGVSICAPITVKNCPDPLNAPPA
jgi:hypothetical protein